MEGRATNASQAAPHSARGRLASRPRPCLASRFARPLVAGALLAISTLSASAGEPGGTPSADAGSSEEAAARKERQAELDQITHDMELTEQRQAELRKEIDALDKDRATLNQHLIDTGQRVQNFEGELDKTEARMNAIAANEAALRDSLNQRRDVLAEVLAALQRMGRRPPPALLVRPEDALASVRSAMLLGAVVPDLRAAADKVAADLRQLLALRNEMVNERDRMRAELTSLAEEKARVQLLIEEKRDRRAASIDALAEEQRKAAALADQATSLKDLIARMEKEIAASARASAAAEKAAEANRQAALNGHRPTTLGNADRLAPAIAFADAKGLLPRPVNGMIVKRFGDDDGLGARTQGISIATRPGAEVNSPSDGWVVYAGPFRSYGQLLIINAGGGYHVLLAGMERIDVQLGQFVLAGEPVAMMASQRLASAVAVDVGAKQPVLYIEFRKDGTSIDPAPWWAASSDEKVGG
jgi:septal ring factor EnvC (AmiA/AmiB activator)